MSQVLRAFELLDFTMLRPILAWRTFWNQCTVYFFNFPFFSGRGKPWILNQRIRGHDCTCGAAGNGDCRGGDGTRSGVIVIIIHFVLQKVTRLGIFNQPLIVCYLFPFRG
jgi:hypothetical protein